MSTLDFSGKTCPVGYDYSPVTLSEYLKGRRFNHKMAMEALERVKLLVEEHNAKQSSFADFAVFALTISAKSQTLMAILTTVETHENCTKNSRFEQVLDALAGPVEVALAEVYGGELTFETESCYLYAELDD